MRGHVAREPHAAHDALLPVPVDHVAEVAAVDNVVARAAAVRAGLGQRVAAGRRFLSIVKASRTRARG